MKKLLGGSCGILLALSLLGLSTPQVALADRDHDDKDNTFRAKLTGLQEVPAVSTVAKGTFSLTVVDANTLTYELTFSGLQGVVTQSHIHFAQPNVSGGIMIWLCQTATNVSPTAGVPTCPAGVAGGTVTGTITAASVIGAATNPQQIVAGELAEAVAAIKKGFAYANIHSSLSPAGEIRGQIRGDD